MTTVTYEEAIPRRPALDDLGGLAYENDPDFPPNPGEEPDAESYNQSGLQVLAHSRVIEAAKIEVDFAAGAPFVSNLWSLKGNLTIPDLTVTDNGAGDTSITWAANTFPTGTMSPSGLTIVEDVEIDRARAIPISNGVQVKTKLGGTGTDAKFVVCVNRQ